MQHISTSHWYSITKRRVVTEGLIKSSSSIKYHPQGTYYLTRPLQPISLATQVGIELEKLLVLQVTLWWKCSLMMVKKNGLSLKQYVQFLILTFVLMLSKTQNITDCFNLRITHLRFPAWKKKIPYSHVARCQCVETSWLTLFSETFCKIKCEADQHWECNQVTSPFQI